MPSGARESGKIRSDKQDGPAGVGAPTGPDQRLASPYRKELRLMSDSSSVPSASDAALAVLRREIAGLVAAIDVGEMPRPDRIRSNPNDQPGAEWRPAHHIRIFTLDTEDDTDTVYMAQEVYGYSMPGDWESFKPEDARRVGMALLAAADWAEQHRANIPRLDRIRAARGGA